jgi:hypothetical protein
MNVEKYIIRKKRSFSTISTFCGQTFTTALNKLSTAYPQFVDKCICVIELLRVKTQI